MGEEREKYSVGIENQRYRERKRGEEEEESLRDTETEGQKNRKPVTLSVRDSNRDRVIRGKQRNLTRFSASDSAKRRIMRSIARHAKPGTKPEAEL